MKSNRSFLLLIVALAFLLFYVIYYFFVQIPKGKLEELTAKTSSLAFDNSLLDAQVMKFSNMKLDVNEDKVQKQFPLWDNTEQIVYALDNWSKSSNITYHNIVYSITETNSLSDILELGADNFMNVKELTVVVESEGTYDEMKQWLDKVQKMDRVIVVTRFEYSSERATTEFKAFYDPSYENLLENPQWWYE